MDFANSTNYSLTPATSLGALAWQCIEAGGAARVLGVASRGVFLHVPPRRILFVSVERFRSPLTINLDRSVERWRGLEVGAAAHFSSARLIFPSIAFSISLPEDSVWQCPLPPSATCSPAEQRRTLRSIVEGVLIQRGGDGLAAVLPALLDWPVALALSTEQAQLLERLRYLRQAITAGDDTALLAGLMGLLGQGRGLTPSGDDVAIGVLLMLARSRRSQRVNSLAGKENMLKHVIDMAYQNTTTLSANLIECAAHGQGDERLIAVVDGIVAGLTSIDVCVECALDWGSSSGIDALVGMAVAL
jgi:hypothetical protein